MNGISLCLELSFDETCENPEEAYQNTLKPLLSFLYTHPRFSFTFAISGKKLEYLSVEHPEALEILRELTSRNQTEVLGNGFYSPIFPLLFPLDRSGQIEKMNAKVRETVGKRPRGLFLLGGFWDSSLIPSFHTCGMEYVHFKDISIDESLSYFPYILNEQGKKIIALIIKDSFLPFLDSENKLELPENWLKKIRYKIQSENQDDKLENAVICLQFSIKQMESLILSDFLNETEKVISQKPSLLFFLETPQQYLKHTKYFVKSYFLPGMEKKISQWAKSAGQNGANQPLTIYDFFSVYEQNQHLYERTLYVSMLLSQSHGGDKMRKYSAREHIWEAQSAEYYIDLKTGQVANEKNRQMAYRALSEAENLIRESRNFTESITSFDYNLDGLNEYVCQMEKFNAVISLTGAKISDLSILFSGANYTSTSKSHRGIFIEHLFDFKEMDDYLNQKEVKSDVFENLIFSEKKCDTRRNQIVLEGEGQFSPLKMPVILTKHYTVTSDGFIVQYILRNNSPFLLKGFFVSEINFAQTLFELPLEEQYNVEVISSGMRQELPLSENCKLEKGVSHLQISDKGEKTILVFEPNEEAGLSTNAVSSVFTSSFYWTVDLAVDRAIEKTIKFSIIHKK